MKDTHTRFPQATFKVLIWLGLALCFLGVSAGYLGIAKWGLGFKEEILILLGGAGLSITSWLSLWIIRTGWNQVRARVWPSLRTTIIIVSVSVMITATDIHFSTQFGLLAHPPVYDGIGYIIAAKSAFYVLQAGGLEPATLSHTFFTYFTFVPLWEGLMLLSFWLFGEGEWQAFTIRFWPSLLLLLLVFWVVRRRGSASVAWLAVVFTALLPTISVGLRSSAWEYLTGANVFGPGWYLADLRPDLLFAVLLLWTVVPPIERVDNLNRNTWCVSGTAAALAILAKSSTMPVLLLAGGLTSLYVLIVNRHRLRATMVTAAWGMIPFVILLTPWILVGGPRTTATYVYHHLTVARPLWSNPDATFLSEAGLYWEFFAYHMGQWESWLVLGCGLVLWLARVHKEREQGHGRLLAYLLVAGFLYGLVSATPNKNLFLGLPYYLLLWLFSWAALAPSLTAFGLRNRLARTCLILFPTLYGGIVVGAAFYALHHWPVEKQLRPLESRKATEQIAGDLRAVLTQDDAFVYVPFYGYPAALQYYMMDDQGQFPQAGWVDPTTAPPMPRFLQEKISPSKAVLVFEQDIEEVAKYVPMNRTGYPYWRAIAEWVRRPESPFRLVRTYRLWGQFPDRPIAIRLYVKEPELTVAVGDNEWPNRAQFNHGPHAGQAYAFNGADMAPLFRSDFDALEELQINRYGEGGGLTLVPTGLADGDVAGRYESRDNRDHLATPYFSPQKRNAGLFFFSAWVRPLEGGSGPTLWLQDENYAFLSRAEQRMRRPDGWILLVGVAEKTGAGQVRLVLMEPPGTVSLIDKMLLVEASRE